MKKSKTLLVVLALVAVLAVGLLVACDNDVDVCEHAYGEWSLTVAPTEEQTGYAVHICATCSHAEVVEVPVLGDQTVWTAVKTNATHTTAGHITYTSVYGRPIIIAVDKLATHVYDKEVVDARYLKDAADCEHAAVYYKTCECGAVGTDTFESGNPNGHTAVANEEVPATCSQDGLTGGTHCSVCGETIEASTVVGKIAHTAVANEEVPATCSQDGLTGGTHCSVCGETIEASTVVNKKGHNIVTDIEHPATCTVPGVTEGKHCADCGLVIVPQNVIPLAEHIPGSEATCTQDQVCVVCGGIVVEKHHVWSEDYRAADTSEGNVHAHYCTVCDEIDTDSKVEHTYGEEHLVSEKDHNGHDMSLVHDCSVCGYVGVINDKLGYLEYAWEKGVQVEPTYIQAGYVRYTKDEYTYDLPIAKLVAPFEGRTYYGFWLNVDSSEPNKAVSLNTWNDPLCIDANGNAVYGMSPLMGDVEFCITGMLNASVAEISVTNTYVKNKGAEDETTEVREYVGCVDLESGMIVFTPDGLYNRVYVLTPYGTTKLDDLNASTFVYDGKSAVAISYDIRCNVGDDHRRNIFVNDGEVFFNVRFESFEGQEIEGKDCYNNSFTAIDKEGNAINAWAYDGELHIADGCQGKYAIDLGEGDLEITLSGCGQFAIEGGIVGTYAPVSGDDNTAEVYVMEGETKVAYYLATIDVSAKRISLTMPVASLSFDVGGKSDAIEAMECNVNIAYDLPVPVSNDKDYAFAGWYTDIDDESTKLGATYTATSTDPVELYAKWWNIIISFNIHDEVNGDSTVQLTPEVEYGTKLPALVVGEFYGDKMFEGWFEDAEYEYPFETTDLSSASVLDVDVYAKYAQAGTWSITLNTASTEYPFEYADGEWVSTNQGKNNTKSVMKITASGGPIKVTFKYWASSESDVSYDYLEIYYDTIGSSARTLVKAGGTTMTATDAKDFIAVIPEGKSVDLTYKKDSSQAKGSDTAYIIDLRINGIKIVNTAGKDNLAGTYTSDENTIVLNGYGTITHGDEEGMYYEVANADFNAIANIGDKVYKITLSESTYTMIEYEVSVTYNYLNGTTESAIDTYYYNKAITLREIGDVTNGSKVFAGWYTKDGSENDDWGTLLESGIKATADITAYAKWVDPHVMYGTYKGASISMRSYYITNGSPSANTAMDINAFGELSSHNSGYVATYTDGKVAITKGSSTYAGVMNLEEGILIKQSTAGNNYGWYVFARTNGDLSLKSVSYVGFDASSTCALLVNLTFSDDTTKCVFMHRGSLYVNVTWTAEDANGVAITDITKLKNDAKYITVTAGDNSFAYAKKSSNLSPCDGTQGTYTCEGKDNLTLDGVGGIICGVKNGTYVSAGQSAGYAYDVTLKASDVTSTHKLTIDVVNKTYTMEDNLVTITFVNDKVAVDPEQVYYNVSKRLPEGSDLNVEDFKFLGWFENETATSRTWSVTPKADMTYYARYAAAVELKFDYDGQGTQTVSVPNRYVGDKVGSDIPTVGADVMYGDKVFAGWFLKSADGKFTTDQADKNKVLEGDLTYYAKWVDPHPLRGTYLGFEFDTTQYRTYKKELTVDALGNAKLDTTDYGAMTYDSATGLVTFSKRNTYAYYDASSQTFRINYAATNTGFTTDTYVMTKVSGSSAPISNNSTDVVRWGNNTYQLGMMTIDGNNCYFYLTPVRVYGKVSVSATLNGNAVTKLSDFTQEGVVFSIIDCNGNSLITLSYDGTSFVESDGKNGMYTTTDVSAYGDLILDGYGNLTIGQNSVRYTLNGNILTFVNNNRMCVIELATSTYTRVLDGYQGTYTLPDTTDTMALDGYGQVTGTSKTYVVNGASIVIYDGETSATYSIDVDEKTLLGKSPFAGLTFVGKYYDEFEECQNNIKFIFDDSSELTGVLASGNNDAYKANFTAAFDGETLAMTVTVVISGGVTEWKGKTLTATLSGNSFTITSWEGKSNTNTYSFANAGSVTCADYVG